MYQHLVCLARPFTLRNTQSLLKRPGRIQETIGPVASGGLSRVHARFAASSVSGRPGSQSVEHATQNVKEELGNSLTDWAREIAGGVFTVDTVKPRVNSFLGITGAVAVKVPTPLFVMGLAGGLPYIASAGTTVYLAHQAGLAAIGVATNLDPGVALTVLDQALNFQVHYGAVLLSFLGALHWGMEIAGYGGYKGYRRLCLGVAPAILAWSTITLEPMSALLCQWLGFVGLWYADNRATAFGWTPVWYSQYRFYLSLLVGTCIIGSLAGTSYYGPVAGHGLLSHDLYMIRAERNYYKPERCGVVKGEVEAVPAGEDADSYVIVRRKHRSEEGSESEEAKEQQ
ncbi:hypothetical protein PISMIDRAFT_679520 [Pisolithus microcarpus 441]|uniref:Uncharacterized protein n=1 Tax=Pisolithus microcarpus 441 TaxID=765257 RepID=A0A0C9ZLJ0_9AGAM|nr:hypothetical protein BKA83DRAFT_679520 [Pisolithus microcarpus]KIK23247.1 hypothetical protein PISMIDRAFT_679520 [Pisolithus microcarpus 441]